MAIFPGAIYRPITASKGRRRLTEYNRVNLHVAVSEAASLFGYFNKSGIPDSHFYVRKDGTVEQYVDTAYQAFADLEGNDATISIETQGGVTNSQGEPWTPQQVETLAQIYAWAVRTHGIARKMATSSQKGDASKGLSWHRLGIDGNFPALPDLRAGRQQRGGGMRYSSSRGKICPGDAKILQVPTIFARAEALLGGAAPAPAPAPSPAPTPAPAPAPKPSGPNLKVDGYWGPATTRALQKALGTVQDGVISAQNVAYARSNPGLEPTTWQWVAARNASGSNVIRALQAKVGTRVDGVAGPMTFKALQRYLGTTQDGVISAPSNAVKELQRRLNAGKF